MVTMLSVLSAFKQAAAPAGGLASLTRSFSSKIGGYTVIDHKYDAIVVGAGVIELAVSRPIVHD